MQLDKAADEQNLLLAHGEQQVEALLEKFYDQFPYPWVSYVFDRPNDPDHYRVFVNQDIGDWKHRRIPRDTSIWVAGCGTNQAVTTALRFPDATVLGTDLSQRALEACASTAADLGLSNLELRQESINGVSYRERFDYVICTGVIHHNADPRAALRQLAKALTPDGVLELMVYNRFHRLQTSAFQRAVRILSGSLDGAVDFASELDIAKRVIRTLRSDGSLVDLLSSRLDMEEAGLADSLLNPVEHSYTIESLSALATGCGLTMLAPSISPADRLGGTYAWHLRFEDPDLRRLQERLPDERRWMLVNLLAFERSPMLWFYLQRSDRSPRVSEQQRNDEFLRTPFMRSTTSQRRFIREPTGGYRMAPADIPLPMEPPDGVLGVVAERADGTTPMRDLLKAAGCELSFDQVSSARLGLSSSAFPYLRAVRS